jgi:tRNA(Ile)-lysidine synthase
VALLVLLCRRRAADLALHVVHLDHETRAGASAEDAAFVRALARQLSLPHTIRTLSAVESALAVAPPPNRSARFRAARLALFRDVVAEQRLAGALLAHHADDQAETVLHRLIRGSHAPGLAGMALDAELGGLRIMRPLLRCRHEALRAALTEIGQPWREDASNASDDYLRNRIRRVLAQHPGLTPALLRVADSSRALRDWMRDRVNPPGDVLPARDLLSVPLPVRRELARRWLARVGVPRERIEPDVVARLLAMAGDAASPARQHFPGRVLVRRTRGVFSATIGNGSERR